MLNLITLGSFVSGVLLTIGVIGLVVAFRPRPKQPAVDDAARRELREEARIRAASGEVDLAFQPIGVEQLLLDSVEKAECR